MVNAHKLAMFVFFYFLFFFFLLLYDYILKSKGNNTNIYM
jgi:hypothetical protein